MGLKYFFTRYNLKKRQTCEKIGHKMNHCICVRCKMVDSARHVWEGCRCGYCGAIKDINDPSHEWAACKCKKCGAWKNIADPSHNWMGCKCSNCGQTRDEGHNWEAIESKYFGGNDVNGWGPGGETHTEYRCVNCGDTWTGVDYDDDNDE